MSKSIRFEQLHATGFVSVSKVDALSLTLGSDLHRILRDGTSWKACDPDGTDFYFRIIKASIYRPNVKSTFLVQRLAWAGRG